MSTKTSSNSSVPVFVFPLSVDFHISSAHTHKQLLTIYNPYSYPVSFTVLSTSPHKFSVIDPEGSISPQSCIDIIVRYVQPSQDHCDHVDKFRVIMTDKNTQQHIGRRDVMVKFLNGEPENNSSDSTSDKFHTMGQHKGSSSFARSDISSCGHRDNSPNFVAIIMGILCIIALLLPTQPESQVPSSLPSYLHLSMQLKLVAAFILGLVSIIILRA